MPITYLALSDDVRFEIVIFVLDLLLLMLGLIMPELVIPPRDQ